MTKKVKLSKKREQWLGKRNVTLKGTPLHHDIKSQLDYKKNVSKLYKNLEKATEEKIKDVFRKYDDPKLIKSHSNKILKDFDKKYTAIFEKKSKKIAADMVKKNLRNSEAKLKISMKKLLGDKAITTTGMTPAIKKILDSSISNNIDIISGIPSKYLKGIKKSINDVIEGKGTIKELDKQFSKRRGQSKRYIKNMTGGESRKVYNNINLSKMASLGVNCFEWVETYQAAEPRHLHIELSGQIFFFDNLPVIDEEGNRGLPGDAYYCHCIMIPRLAYADGRLI